MTRALHRWLDRLSGRVSAGRLITLSVAHEHADDADMINATLAAAGIEREGADLIVLLKIYAALGSEPPCTLQSVLPLAPNGLKVLR